MTIYLNLINGGSHQPSLDLVGDDDLKDELELFLKYGMTGVNSFNVHYLSKYVFNSNGHPRWDFTFKDEREYNSDDWGGLVSLNLAWDVWYSARNLEVGS